MIRTIKSYKIYFFTALLTLSCTPAKSHLTNKTAEKKQAFTTNQAASSPYSKKEISKKEMLYIVKLQAQPLAQLKKQHPEFKSIIEFKNSSIYKRHQEELAAQRAEFTKHLKQALTTASVVGSHEFATNSVIVKAPLKSQAKILRLKHVISVHQNKDNHLIR